MFANCHNHSTFSDGAYTPEQIAALAKREGYGAIILTDHDTVRGTYFMQGAARRLGMLSLLGCEFSVKGLGTYFHLLGFDFNPDDPKMKELLAYTSAKQTKRSEFFFNEGIKRGTLRGGITWQDVLDDHPHNDYFCNNQVFETMVRLGIYKREEYFDEFFIPNFKGATMRRLYGAEWIDEVFGADPDIEYVIKCIKEAGGVPVVAHPHGKEKYVDRLVELGVMGFETVHPDLVTREEREFFDSVCTERGLYKMGGTDHSGVLGGFADIDPALACTRWDGGVSEEDFMKLYERRLG